jgi:hypothetical protein
MDSGVLVQILGNLLAFVDSAPIPQHNNGSPQMPEERLQESLDLQPGEVLCVELQVKGQVFPLGGYRKGTNGRNLASFKDEMMVRGLPYGGPGAGKVGDEQKAAFIEKNQVGTKFLGFFLSVAIYTASSVRWPPHPASHRDALAADNSSPGWSAASTHGRDGRARRTGARSVWRRALKSIGHSGSRPPGVLAGAGARACFSGRGITGKADPGSVGIAAPAALFCGKPATSERLNSQRRSRPALWPTSSCQTAVTGQRVDAASLTAVGFPGVSYPRG